MMFTAPTNGNLLETLMVGLALACLSATEPRFDY